MVLHVAHHAPAAAGGILLATGLVEPIIPLAEHVVGLAAVILAAPLLAAVPLQPEPRTPCVGLLPRHVQTKLGLGICDEFAAEIDDDSMNRARETERPLVVFNHW